MPYVTPRHRPCAPSPSRVTSLPARSPARPRNDAGKAAIVLVTTNHKLLFSFVLAKLPEDFSPGA